MAVYGIESTLLLPFRSWLPPCEASGRYLDDQWDTTVVLTYPPLYTLSTRIVDSTQYTAARVRTSLTHPGDKESARTWARNNAGAIVADTIIPRLNYLFLQLKRSYPLVVLTGRLRSVGDIDPMHSTLAFEGEGIMARGSSSATAALVPPPAFLMEGRRRPDGPVVVDPKSPGPLSNEWIAITRAVDLVNHGYLAEAFLVGFALLDGLVQNFVKDHLPNLKPEDAATFLPRIGTLRLDTFLGPLLRICLGASPLDDAETGGEIKWLNERRNKIVHQGEPCLRGESQRAIRAVLSVLCYLNARGANYSLPDELEFYTPPAAESLASQHAQFDQSKQLR